MTDGVINSYVTVAAAEIYFFHRLYSSSWGRASENDKGVALIMATKAINQLTLKGRKAALGQSLAFPRHPDTDVPVAVKDACCEEALALLERGNDQRRKLQQEGVQSFTLGNMSETYAAGAGKGLLLSQEAKELLRPWLLGGVFIT